MPQRVVLGLVLLLGFTQTAVTQQRVGAPPIVEVLGLRTWTVQMLADSVAKYRPDVSLADAACAAILRDSVGFGDAAVRTIMDIKQGKPTQWKVLSVVEPADAEKVRFRPNPTAEFPPHSEWGDLFGLLDRDRRAVSYLQHPDFLLGRTDTVNGQAAPAPAIELRDALRRHRSTEDWRLARLSILEDRNRRNRAVAALVLSNFAARDSAWYLLAEGLRHPSDPATEAADMMLSALARSGDHIVHWRPAQSALRALLGGTNLYAYPTLLSVLTRTGLNPALGRELVQVNPRLLLGHLGAQNPLTPPPAHEFLVHISQKDFGKDPVAWKKWFDAMGMQHSAVR